jgi:RNA polymerase sigma-70 factor (sigma-E family)
LTFDEFVTVRLGGLLRYATAVTADPHLAQDVVQDVLVRAHQQWGRIAAADQPEAYVKRMVLNEYLSWRRRLGRRTQPASDEVIAAASPPADDHADAVANRSAMTALIAALPPRQRAVLALRYFEGQSDAQIADVLGCSEATVRSHAARALATLRAAATTTILNGAQDDRG